MITKKALSGAFYIEYNMNDTFYWACADRCKMPTEDFFSLEPLYEKYGYDLIIAYEALNRGHDPEHEEVCSSEFYEAKKEISSRLSTDFCSHLFKVIQEREAEKKIFNGQEVFYKNYKRTLKDKVISFIKREKYIPIKVIAYVDSGEMAIGFNRYNAKDKLIEIYSKGKKDEL